MYYLELTERFWTFNQTAYAGSTAVAMYLYLLKTAKDHDAYVFVVSDVVVSKELGLTRKTVKSTKERLRDLGLIQFQTKNGLPCAYRLLLNYNMQISEPEKIRKSEVQKLPVFTEADEAESLTNSALQTFSLPEIADAQNNNLSPASLNVINSEVPDFEEFIAYAKTLEMYEGRLDASIRERYESWTANGWRNVSGKPVTNWRLSLKSILPFMKNASQNDELSIQSLPNIKRPKSTQEKSKSTDK